MEGGCCESPAGTSASSFRQPLLLTHVGRYRPALLPPWTTVVNLPAFSTATTIADLKAVLSRYSVASHCSIALLSNRLLLSDLPWRGTDPWSQNWGGHLKWSSSTASTRRSFPLLMTIWNWESGDFGLIWRQGGRETSCFLSVLKGSEEE